METEICLMCQTEDAMFMWELGENEWVPVCECCRRIINDKVDEDLPKPRFMEIKEYYAKKELNNGAQGMKLTQ